MPLGGIDCHIYQWGIKQSGAAQHLQNLWSPYTDRDRAPPISILFRVLRVHKNCSHGVDVRRDRLDQKRRDEGIFDEGEPLRIPLQAPINHLHIDFRMGAGLNGEQILAARLAVLCHPETDAFADPGVLTPIHAPSSIPTSKSRSTKTFVRLTSAATQVISPTPASVQSHPVPSDGTAILSVFSPNRMHHNLRAGHLSKHSGTVLFDGCRV